ncbi:amino acid ABC transporter permease [Nocardia sp. 2YAB30]|uniref:amino acid ABC transporter permease n=1 Tax=unclassified Nocardia TaxID=2637762 RepID=UPI003F96DF89
MHAVVDNLPRYIDGLEVTLTLLATSTIGALVLGTAIAVLRIVPIPSLRAIATIYTEILRNTSLTLVLFFCAIILPYLGSNLPYIVLAIIGLSFYTSAFVAEAIRSGINGVPVGQAEAARSIGLGFRQSVSLVILPQAFTMTIPPLISVLIALTKNTAVAGGFFVVDLFTIGKELTNENGDSVLTVLLGVATCYVLITAPLGIMAARLERKWRLSR